MKSRIDFASLADGAVEERLNLELLKVFDNIADPNTDPKKARKITLTISLAADNKRDVAVSSVQVKTTLVPAKNIETKFVMGMDADGIVVGAELKSGMKDQMMIDNDGELATDTGVKVQPPANVVGFGQFNK